MQKALQKRIESAIEAHGGYAIRQAENPAIQGNRDALREMHYHPLEFAEIIILPSTILVTWIICFSMGR